MLIFVNNNNYLSMWGSLLYHGMYSWRKVKDNSKVATDLASHLIRPMFLVLGALVETAADAFDEDAVEEDEEDSSEEVELSEEAEWDRLRQALLRSVWFWEVVALWKFKWMRHPRSPRGSDSAIRRISREIAGSNFVGKTTSPAPRYEVFAARKASSKWKVMAWIKAEISGLASTSSSSWWSWW